MELCLKIIDKDGKTKAVERGEGEVNLAYSQTYQEGGRINLKIPEKGSYFFLQLDDALGKSLVYLTGNVSYLIPFDDRRMPGLK